MTKLYFRHDSAHVHTRSSVTWLPVEFLRIEIITAIGKLPILR